MRPFGRSINARAREPALSDRTDPAALWEMYLQLTQFEQAFKDLKSDLSVRPVYHQLDRRIEAHIMVCFLSHCVHITLR